MSCRFVISVIDVKFGSENSYNGELGKIFDF